MLLSLTLSVLCALSATEPAVSSTLEETRLIESEAEAGVGLLGSGYAVVAQRWGDTVITPALTGRFQKWGLVGEVGAMFFAPVTQQGAGWSVVAQLRVGYSGVRWSVLLGATGQFANLGRPQLQLLPSLRAQWEFHQNFGMTVGVLEQFAMVPAHLSLNLYRRYSVGWAFPLGFIGEARFPINDDFGVKVSAFFVRLGTAEIAMLSVAGTFGGAR
jgi:hypothetical protein